MLSNPHVYTVSSDIRLKNKRNAAKRTSKKARV